MVSIVICLIGLNVNIYYILFLRVEVKSTRSPRKNIFELTPLILNCQNNQWYQNHNWSNESFKDCVSWHVFALWCQLLNPLYGFGLEKDHIIDWNNIYAYEYLLQLCNHFYHYLQCHQKTHYTQLIHKKWVLKANLT